MTVLRLASKSSDISSVCTACHSAGSSTSSLRQERASRRIPKKLSVRHRDYECWETGEAAGSSADGVACRRRAPQQCLEGIRVSVWKDFRPVRCGIRPVHRGIRTTRPTERPSRTNLSPRMAITAVTLISTSGYSQIMRSILPMMLRRPGVGLP